MMVRAKMIYILIVNKLFSSFSCRYMFFVFLSSYRNTRESLEELEKGMEKLACGPCSHSISRSPKIPVVLLFNK